MPERVTATDVQMALFDAENLYDNGVSLQIFFEKVAKWIEQHEEEEDQRQAMEATEVTLPCPHCTCNRET